MVQSDTVSIPGWNASKRWSNGLAILRIDYTVMNIYIYIYNRFGQIEIPNEINYPLRHRLTSTLTFQKLSSK